MGAKFELIAKTFKGLEEVLAKELVKLGAEKVVVLRRGVSFEADLALMYKANLCCRTALRIIKPIYKFKAADADEVYERIKNFEWENYLDNEKTFAIDSVVYSEAFRHSKYLSYRVKDAIVDRFREKTGERPSVRLNNPDLKINVHVANMDVTISLDSSGEPLFKRGYRTDQTEAPINEVLAAGLLMLAGWDGQKDLIDPMCGSGTFLVEAALIAKNIAPGIYRKSFAFEKWKDFDADLFQTLYNDDSQEREFEHTIYGSDILKDAINIATDNVKSAGMSDNVKLKVCPIEELPVPSKNALVIFNPPYGERLKPEKLGELYDNIGKKLKNDFTGMNVWIITEPTEETQHIGLAPSKRIAIDNGGIQCEFRKYEIFAGRRDDYMKEKSLNGENEEEKKEENLGYTFFEYDYDEPGDKKEDERETVNGHRTLGHHTSDGSRSARPRVAGYHTDRAEREGKADTDFDFDTPEEKEEFLERKQRHERFVSKQQQSERPRTGSYERRDNRDRDNRDRDNRDRDNRDRDFRGRDNRDRRDRNSDREHRSHGSYGNHSNNGGGYPQDRINGGHSVQRSGERSWNRDGYRPREEREGSRPKHDFRNDNHKPTRNFRRDKGSNRGGEQ